MPGEGSTSLAAECALGLLGVPPVAARDVVAVHPDLTDRAGGILDPGLGVDDAHGGCARWAVTDQLGTTLSLSQRFAWPADSFS